MARAQSDLPYDLPAAYSTALRYVRIDRGCKIVDKDNEAAFIAFECQEERRTKRGAFEIYRLGPNERAQGNLVRAQLTLSDETHGMELRWLELFERKLRDERGTPLPANPKAHEPDKAAKDAGH